jgi:REP element-mobilizing transposase RayT
MYPCRRSIRLPGFDYGRPGAYFVTIGTWRMRPILGRVTAGGFEPNDLGRIVGENWRRIPDHFPTICLDAWCVMPNHLHGILWLQLADGSPGLSPPLGLVVRIFKASAARRINRMLGMPGAPVWHRNYYERILRTRGVLEHARWYIELNPRRWWQAKGEKNLRRP